MSEPERTDDARPAEGRGRRGFDPGSAVTGLFFLAVAGIFIAAALSGDPVADPRMLGPALLVGLGVVGIVRVATRSRRH
ncbi:hypothetical protein GCM10010191_81080 [Actinomadura vinacea]|uniref:Uncharacterized protein n=1 Tax=Actinomadura vinacea TaxID=115336 RepID=A0ABN3K6H3_9ACTN